MPKKRTTPARSTPLRLRAGPAVRASRTDIARMSPEEKQRLVYELQVHQIELEMQNEELRRAHGELAQSRDRFNHLYDFAPVGYVTLDPDGTVLEANLTLAAMLGVERGKLVGAKFARFVARDSQDTLYLHQHAVLDGEVRKTCDLSLRADGKSFAARMQTIGIRDSDSGACHYRSAIIDITERNRAEQALRENEERLRLAVDGAGMGTWDVELKTGTTVWNRQHYQILGFEPNNAAPNWEMWRSRIHPDDLDRVLAARKSALKTRGLYNPEHRIVRADNGEIRWVAPFARYFYSDTGAAIRFAGVDFDITERKHAEQALRESEERFRGTFDNAAVGIAHVAPDGRWLRVNDKFCQIVGYGREQLLSKTFQDITHADDVSANLALVQRALAGKVQTYAMEKRYIRCDGSAVWVNLTTSLIREPQTQAPLYFIAVVENISKRKRAEDQLREFAEDLERQIAERTAALRGSQEQLRALAGRLHELQEAERTQLAIELHDEFGAAFTALKVDLHWIMARLPKSVDGVEQKARVMSDLIDNSVESVRRTASLLRPRLLDDFGLVAAIEWQTTDFQRRTGIQCVTRLPEEVDLAQAMSTALYRILQESLTNVARHAKATEVHVGLRIDGGKVMLDVQDNGIGFDLEAALNDRSFGLFGMQERAYAFGGHVRFESRPLHGATVTVEIPLARTA
jgi:two-component system sensor histidine kinase UhpB